MKLLPILLLLTIGARAQTGSSLSVYSVYPAGGLFHGPVLSGGSQDPFVTHSVIAGADYGYGLTRWLSVHAGLEWSQFKIYDINYSDEPLFPNTTTQMGYLDLISIPLTLKFQFLKYAYFQGGLLWDNQVHNHLYTDYSGHDGPETPQAGLGATGNLGGNYTFPQHLTLSAAFCMEFHGVHLTQTNPVDHRLTAYGLRLALSHPL
jgi:hypothetical protein